jgi:hypothetical protein
MTRWQISVRFGQAANELVAEDDAGLSADMLASGDMEVAAADSRVRDVNRYPSRPGFRDWYRPDGDDSAAFPDQRVLLGHLLRPIGRWPIAKVRFLI